MTDLRKEPGTVYLIGFDHGLNVRQYANCYSVCSEYLDCICMHTNVCVMVHSHVQWECVGVVLLQDDVALLWVGAGALR